MTDSDRLTEAEIEELKRLRSAYLVSHWTSYINTDGSTIVQADAAASAYFNAIVSCEKKLLEEIARLRADAVILAFGDPAHTHACPYWHIGRKHGPCVCRAKELQDQVDAARERVKQRSFR